MAITARVRQSSHPHQGAAQAALARHIVLDAPLTGRLRREAGDALCRPAVDFYELERTDVEGDATCKKCLERAARYGVRVITTATAKAEHEAARKDTDSAGQDLIEGAIYQCTAGHDGCTLFPDEEHPLTLIALPASAGPEPRPADVEQDVVEGMVVDHADTAEGSLPRHAAHPDVAAAREALDGLAAATMTDHHDVTEPTEDEQTVRGYLVDPRTHGRVAVYWLEQGRIVRHDDPWHGPALDCLADRLRRRGWAVEKMLRSSQCVFAHLPAEGTAPAPQKTAATVEPAPAAPVPGTLVDPWTWVRRPASSYDTRRTAPAAVEPAAPECLHRIAVRPDVSGDPITTCARKQPNQEAGVFSDEGCVEAYDCAVQAANRAAEMNAEDDAPTGNPLHMWDLLCVEHRDSEQQVDTCEECNAAEDQPDTTAAELSDTVDAVEKAERVDGTWRGSWIAGTTTPADEVLFALDPADVEQGALFI